MNLNSIKLTNIFAALAKALFPMLFSLLAMAPIFATAQVNKKKQMNVLFIAIDDLRPELSAYGASPVKSPNIDNLANQGATFIKAFCQYPLCAPSRASVFTGTRPTSTLVYDLYTDFRIALPDVQSLPQLFKNNGYNTDRVGKIFHIDDNISWTENYPVQKFGPLEPGIRSPYASKELNEAGWRKFEIAKVAGVKGVALERSQRGPTYEIVDLDDDELPDGKIALKGIEALKQLKQNDKPFFLAVGFNKPHLPFVAPRKYWDLYDPANIKVPTNNIAPINAPYALGSAAEFYTYIDVPKTRPVPDEYTKIARQGYYACVSYVDALIGRVLTALKEEGLAENTIVVLWGDHGFKLGEHGSWGKSSNFELDARIPLIIKAPGFPKNSKINGLVEAIDIYPTLAELAGIKIPESAEGTSLVSLLKNPSGKGKKAAYTQCSRGDRMGYSIRTERYRLIRWIQEGEKDAFELYDHLNDAAENFNISGTPFTKKVQQKLLAQMTKDIKMPFVKQIPGNEP